MPKHLIDIQYMKSASFTSTTDSTTRSSTLNISKLEGNKHCNGQIHFIQSTLYFPNSNSSNWLVEDDNNKLNNILIEIEYVIAMEWHSTPFHPHNTTQHTLRHSHTQSSYIHTHILMQSIHCHCISLDRSGEWVCFFFFFFAPPHSLSLARSVIFAVICTKLDRRKKVSRLND